MLETLTYILIALSVIYIMTFFKPDSPDFSDLVRMSKLFEEACTATNLKHWAIGGTALGLYKDKNVLTFDDDLDYGVFELNESQKFMLETLFGESQVQCTEYGYVILDKQSKSAINLFVFVDDGHKLLPKDWVKEEFPNEWMYSNEVDPIVFENTLMGKIPRMNKNEAYISRMYPGLGEGFNQLGSRGITV